MGRLASLLLIALDGGYALSGCTGTPERDRETLRQFVFSVAQPAPIDDKGPPCLVALISLKAKAMTFERKICPGQNSPGALILQGKAAIQHFRHQRHGDSTSGEVNPAGSGEVKIQAGGPKALGDFRGSAARIPAGRGSPSFAVPMLVIVPPASRLIGPCFLLGPEQTGGCGAPAGNFHIDLQVAQADWFRGQWRPQGPPARSKGDPGRLKNKAGADPFTAFRPGKATPAPKVIRCLKSSALCGFLPRTPLFNGQRTRWGTAHSRRPQHGLALVAQIGNQEVRGASLWNCNSMKKWGLDFGRLRRCANGRSDGLTMWSLQTG